MALTEATEGENGRGAVAVNGRFVHQRITGQQRSQP